MSQYAPHITNDDDTTTPLPFKWVICSTCDGNGKHSRNLGCFSAEEWNEQDHEFRDDYMAGRLDSRCEDCAGSGKVRVVDRARCKPELLKRYEEELEDDAAFRREQEAEQRHLRYI